MSGHCWKDFQGHGIKGHIVPVCEFYNGGGMHFDEVAPRLTCDLH